LKGLAKMYAESTGIVDLGGDKDMSRFLSIEPEAVDENLQTMLDYYGKEALDKMKPAEFYVLYREFTLEKP
jgi:hypothetical protein